MSAPVSRLERAIAAWSSLLGPERCLAGTDPRAQKYGEDIGEHRSREIPAVLYPESVADVQAIVQVASTHAVPLYSISTGRNWGMGSRQPVETGGVVVDLAGMNRIRAINVDEGYAVVEPGVTQQALSDALRSTAYIANLTASTPETSVVGNILDKGIGMYRHRVEDLVGIEVVTGEAAVLHVGGYWPTGSPLFHFPSGLGPTLTGLFLQSNFGIVTAGVIRLIPRPEATHILYATLSADHLVPALALFKRLRAEHALDSVIKLYNAHAFHAYNGRSARADDRTFHILAAIHGSAAWVRHVSPFVASSVRAAGCFGEVAMLDGESLIQAPELIQALARIFSGSPTAFAVQRAFALVDADACRDLDRVSGRGFLFVIPVVPATSNAILRTLDVFGALSKQYEVPINTTINLLSEQAAEMVSSVLFSRTPESVARAHALRRALLDELHRQDLPLMRLDVDSQNDPGLFPEAGYRAVLLKLKRLFDPAGILAPGRYIPQG